MSGHTHPCVIPHPVPHLTIGTLGHRGHGKTTLAAALAAASTPGAPGPRRPGYPHRPRRRFRYATDTRRYTLLDPAEGPEHPEYPEHPEGRGDRQDPLGPGGLGGLDGAVLVVSVLEGARSGTADHLALARRSGLAHLVVALSMADAGNDELTELVESDVRAQLTAHGFAGESLPAVRVSARRALEGDPRWQGTIEALLDAVDTYVPLPDVP
ncbi:hypothetical protein KBZ21_12025 [Streptomyces sp. A73]|uniref:GTP-binding protein n=1 Tax=Streptomyces sp. RK75 TaxID=2824895 RepID=UPI000C173D5F|nr:GTP-binding protein [Streptomyces sp. RK75]MBQ0866165.1 hypothetical protein [Streptomyces sp. RK75]MBQ1158850.1 hypothetical protein [Streptomyces sp. A73]